MLACVEVVLRSYAALRDVEAASWIISSFLGPPPNMTLSETCSTGCVRLLDWMWASSCTSVTDRLPQWTLTNYLRSDPHYCRYQFAMSVEITAARGDLVVLEWLFAHFSGCEVTEGAVTAAAGKGHLAVVQFLWASNAERYLDGLRRKKKRRTETGFWNTGMNRKDDPDGAEIERCWGKSTVLFAARSGHYEMVRWLCENTLEEEEKGQGTYDDIIEHALNIGDDDLVKFMLPPGKCVLDYAEDCPRVEVIELMLACGYLHRDAKAAMKAIAHLAGSGEYLELMQQIAQLHSPLREDCSKWIHISSNYWVWWWYAASGNACTRGGLAPVQWLIEHPIGIGMCELIKYYRKSSDLIRDAAWHGHWNIVQYLCQQKITEDYNGPLQYAISNGQLECVEILIQQFVHEERQPMFSPIELAAKYGRLEVVRFLDNCKPQAPLADQRHPDIFARQAWWSQSRYAIFEAAQSGHLEVVKWLHAHRSEDCGTTTMDAAASAGHLDVVKWLHYNRHEGCTRSAMDSAATNGHLPVAQWLHTNRDEGYSSDTMDMAARRGHLNLVKWFYANTSETCSAAAVKQVFRSGPLRVASWLRTHFPELSPVDINDVEDTSRVDEFEMLLFLDAHCPQRIDRVFAEDVRRFILEHGVSWKKPIDHMFNWLKAKGATEDTSQTN